MSNSGDVTQLIDDEDVVEALEVLAKEDQDGLVQPEKVVEAASSPESALHKYFEWDDSEAAHQWRLAQARKLIVRVVIKDSDTRPVRVNVVVRHSDGTERRGYVPVDRAMSDEDMCAQVIYDTKRALISYRTRLAAFGQAEAIVARLDEVLKSMP